LTKATQTIPSLETTTQCPSKLTFLSAEQGFNFERVMKKHCDLKVTTSLPKAIHTKQSKFLSTIKERYSTLGSGDGLCYGSSSTRWMWTRNGRGVLMLSPSRVESCFMAMFCLEVWCFQTLSLQLLLAGMDTLSLMAQLKAGGGARGSITVCLKTFLFIRCCILVRTGHGSQCYANH
jgi:hypothetical protein